MFDVVTSINKVAGSGGYQFVDGIVQVDIDATSLLVRQDGTIITELTGKNEKGVEIDLLNLCGLTGKTLIAGIDFVVFSNGIRAKTITLSAGSVNAYT